MKKMIFFLLACAVLLAVPLCVSATTEDVVHKEGPIAVENPDPVSGQYTALPSESGETVYYGINQIKPEEIIRLDSATVAAEENTSTGSRSVYPRIEFAGALPNNVYSDFADNVITAGSTANLFIKVCVWAPESYNLEIGIYNWTTAENWCVTRSGGYLSEHSLPPFENLTAGTYSVYIRNLGGSSLTTGYMQYRLT